MVPSKGASASESARFFFATARPVSVLERSASAAASCASAVFSAKTACSKSRWDTPPVPTTLDILNLSAAALSSDAFDCATAAFATAISFSADRTALTRLERSMRKSGAPDFTCAPSAASSASSVPGTRAETRMDVFARTVPWTGILSSNRRVSGRTTRVRGRASVRACSAAFSHPVTDETTAIIINKCLHPRTKSRVLDLSWFIVSVSFEVQG